MLGAILRIVGYETVAMIRGGRNEQTAHSDRRRYAAKSAIGFGVGFLGGLVGLVLGSIRLPAMIRILGMDPKVGVGTNLAASSIIGAVSLAGHAINDGVNFEMLAAMGASAAAGGVLGARFSHRFSPDALKRVIGLTLLGVMIFLSFRLAQEWCRVTRETTALRSVSALTPVGVGAPAGI